MDVDQIDRVALVTGASRGIGRALVQRLVSDGWRVGALARSSEPLHALAADPSGGSLDASPAGRPAGQVHTLVADVTDVKAVECASADLVARWCAPDLVVANAGMLAAAGRTWEIDPDVWWAEMRVNVRGTFNVLRCCLPAMVNRGSGRVIVVSSGMGRSASPWMSAYGASKAALTHLVSSVARELEGTGVQIFAISPGLVRTAMTDWPPQLLEFRPDLASLPDGAYLPMSAATDLMADLAGGRFDALTGRFIHARQDRERMLAELG